MCPLVYNIFLSYNFKYAKVLVGKQIVNIFYPLTSPHKKHPRISLIRGCSGGLSLFSEVGQSQTLGRLVLSPLAQAGDYQHQNGHNVGQHSDDFLSLVRHVHTGA